MAELGWMSQRVQALSTGRNGLRAACTMFLETQAVSQSAMLQLMEQRLPRCSAAWAKRCWHVHPHGAVLGELQQRLETIDKAQANIEKLSGNVLSLQDILSNKQTRGAFGEIQLNDIVQKALPSDAYTMQATLRTASAPIA
jgi:DNA recombination protein RmuC